MTDQVFCVLDYETYSEADLRKSGGFEYARHPSTEIICVAYRIGTRKTLSRETTQTWCPREPVCALQGLTDALMRPWARLVAQNAFFEQVITRFVLPRYIPYNMLHTLPNRWTCTASMAAALALPRKLEDMAKVLDLPHQKDMAGHRLMLKHSKPRKPTKNNPATRHRDPEELDRIMRYCATDVDTTVAAFLKMPMLTPGERKVWLLDQKLNFRGPMVDRELVKTALKMIAVETKVINRRVRKLTNGALYSATQRDASLSWLEARGCFLPNLQKKTVEDALTGGLASGVAAELLKLRQAVSKTSTAKYKAFELHSRHDARLRDTLRYHAASTGRWGGSGVQLQNLPRPSIDDTTLAASIVAEGDVEMVRLIYGEPMNVFSSCLRSVIVAPPGHTLDVADYAAIEARVLFWVADHAEGVKAFHDGRKLYEELAMQIFGVSLMAVDPDQRFVGKQATLGCFAADTRVLSNRGWIPIAQITKSDLLWDGVEWVAHQGLISKGEREVIECQGVFVTPEHKILTRTNWVNAEYLEHTGNTKYLQSALSVGLSALRGMILAHAEDCGGFWSPVNAVVIVSIVLIFKISRNGLARAALSALEKRVQKLENTFGGMQKFCPMTHTGSVCLTALHLLFNGVISPLRKHLSTMVNGASRFLNRGERTEPHFSSTCSPSQVGTNLSWKLTVKTSMAGTRLAIFALRLALRMPQTKDKLPILKKKLEVFDVACSGPRNRFTVLSAMGPLVVHNSGYGMGWKKFIGTCKNFGKDVSEVVAQAAIKTYRRVHRPVVLLWSNLELAAIAAVENSGKRFTINHTSWWVKGDFLWCELPSGRRLAYFKPTVRYETKPWGEKGAILYHWGVDAKTKKWVNAKTWGGTLTENVVQAISRDLMAAAMLRIDAAGPWRLVLSVHDELVAEVSVNDRATNAEFCRLMEELPVWAAGCPVKAAGWRGARYRKA